VDILAARKKAAERAQATKTVDSAQPQATPSVPPEAETAPLTAQAAAPAPMPSPPAAIEPVPAAELADPPAESARREAETREIEMLSFRLSGEAYAVFVEDVREVLKVRDLTQVPNAPGYILGVTSLRGRMLPVMDLCMRLALQPAERDEKARIVVVSPDEEDVGLLVDRVTGVIKVLPDSIKPAPDNVEQGEEFLRGIVRHNDTLYIVLDLLKAAG
jgi:purine-binding chemotaxis protein CheW